MELARQVALSFPFIVFTILIPLLALYWLLVAVRLLSVEFFEHDSLKQDHLAGTLISLGFAGVPASFALTALIVIAGGLTLAVELAVLRWLSLGLFRVPLGVAVLWAAFAIASPLAVALCRAPQRWFHEHGSGRRLLGETVVVKEASGHDGGAVAAVVEVPQCEVRLHGKSGDMPEPDERRVLVKYLPGENAFRSVAEADYLEARDRARRLKMKGRRRRDGNGDMASGH